MSWLTLFPKSWKLHLLLSGINYAFKELEAKHVGQLLNEAMDTKAGTAVSNPVQKVMAAWLRSVASELEV